MSNPREGIAALPTPCWVLLDEHGAQQELGQDGIMHLESEADAIEAAEIYVDSFEEDEGPPPTLRPEQLAAPCFTATSACGYRYDIEYEGVEHHESRDELLRTVESAGWRANAAGQLMCDPDCGDCKDAIGRGNEGIHDRDDKPGEPAFTRRGGEDCPECRAPVGTRHLDGCSGQFHESAVGTAHSQPEQVGGDTRA